MVSELFFEHMYQTGVSYTTSVTSPLINAIFSKFFQMICPGLLIGSAHSMNAGVVTILEKFWKKMENFFQMIWRDSQWRTLRENAAEILENFWKKTGKNFPKLFPKFFGLDDLTMLGAIIIFSHLVIIFWKKICITT